MRVVHLEGFFHDGRGPTLLKVHLAPRSAHLEAIDFKAPDSEDKPAPVQHLQFVRAQAFLFTPEEVENYTTSLVDWGATQMGALVSLGRSPWLQTFNPVHLQHCEHYKAMFYDEHLDVICEQVLLKSGPYAPPRSVSGAA
jgi:hypothetical protein